ncbi:MAG: 1,4-alpha-glucan branching protein domain-containing protein [Myxococcota bacterium]
MQPAVGAGDGSVGPGYTSRMFGRFCLVLHGHLPWVLHHGRWPHGEDWLFEAAAETWLPLLEVLDACAAEGIHPGWTVGLTPILLEQLTNPRFQNGLVAFLADRRARAALDAAAFVTEGDARLAALARRWEARFGELAERFEAIGRDVAGAFRAHADNGLIEILSSNATHGYHPLLLHDACGRAQVRAGLATSERILGFRPRGVWLPECAYRPPGSFWPPAVHGLPRDVAGTGSILAEEGVRFFFVDTPLVRRGTAAATVEGGRARAIDPAQPEWDVLRAWNSELEPHRLVESSARGARGDAAGLLPLDVLARCPEVSEQVWSGKIGYPGDGRYLEFHKRHGLRGLRYWRVTSPEADLGDKTVYDPDEVPAAVHDQALHFCELVKARLRMHGERTGRVGVVCAPFDAELFGHWWHEGPQFLLEVARRMARDPDVRPATVGAVLEAAPSDKAIRLPEGSWGAGGDHRVWQNDELRFYWEVEYRAEDRFIDLWHRAPWRTDQAVRDLLSDAARQLLLLQASDWPFVISTAGAIDYGLRRIFEHASLFDDLCNGVEDLITDPDQPADPVVTQAIARAHLLDGVFPDLDLAWWS